ncbi:hypothetical protein T07_5111 [Trichinella nelsoni]|uniref:Uncharacterized protein n=1 Tax=Trichinella nelsoni TaxID=6336 RepID=A0A0V0SD49_9BILA|nr:hypothetical protein T07_5111 [Trichinella nelsoni]
MAGEDFLLWQSASSHILVLATGSNIRLMATRRTWALDGTFKVVPQWYQKLFTIHTFLAGKLVPATIEVTVQHVPECPDIHYTRYLNLLSFYHH